MTDRVVVGASALVAVLLDSGEDGQWAARAIHGADLTAPALLGYEVATVRCRLELAGTVPRDLAVQAHADLLDLTLERWPYEAIGARVWELRTSPRTTPAL